MNLKTYQAVSMADALAEVKRDLGREAVILHTRSFRKGKLFGLFGGRSMWEVTASPNVNVVPRGPRGQYVGAGDVQEAPGAATADHPCATVFDEPISFEHGPLAAQPPGGADAGRLCEMHRMLQQLVGGGGGARAEAKAMPPMLQEFHDTLREQDVEEPIAADLIEQVRMSLTGRESSDRSIVRARLARLIASRIIRLADPSDAPRGMRGRVVALIGPTGVGKTTTIAKLAANMKLKEGKRVGLITIDTYRIAAVDQLRTYAEIIDLPIRTAATPEEMTQAIYAMRGLDLVLIDTVGRSQNDQLRLNQLRAFLKAADADEVHLVVACTTNQRCAAKIVRNFSPLGVTSLIVTKLDETDAYGLILNLAEQSKAPLSYISTGQEVPDDIAPAEPDYLAELILGGSCNDA